VRSKVSQQFDQKFALMLEVQNDFLLFWIDAI
jgi:hypothetical protein